MRSNCYYFPFVLLPLVYLASCRFCCPFRSFVSYVHGWSVDIWILLLSLCFLWFFWLFLLNVCSFIFGCVVIFVSCYFFLIHIPSTTHTVGWVFGCCLVIVIIIIAAVSGNAGTSPYCFSQLLILWTKRKHKDANKVLAPSYLSQPNTFEHTLLTTTSRRCTHTTKLTTPTTVRSCPFCVLLHDHKHKYITHIHIFVYMHTCTHAHMHTCTQPQQQWSYTFPCY